MPSPPVTPRYSVVVPVWNEEVCLPELARRLTAVLEGLGAPFELVFIDDGSRDRTPEILRDLQRSDPRVTVIVMRRNFGQHAAMFAGFLHARGELIFTCDADLQNPPEEFPRLLEALTDDWDVVAGWRQIRYDSPWRKAPSLVFNWMARTVTASDLQDFGCNLRLYRREVTQALAEAAEPSAHLTAMQAWMGFRIREIPVAHHPRGGGVSKYNFFTLARTLNNLSTAYTIFPMQVLWVAGGAMVAAAFVWGAGGLLTGWLRGAPTPTWGWVGSLALFLGGLQLAGIGIVGEYVSRILILAKQRPTFIIKTILSSPPPPES